MSTTGNKSYFLPQIIICENGDEDYGTDTQSSTNDDEAVRQEVEEEDEDNSMINTQDNNHSPSKNEATDRDPPVVAPNSLPQSSDPTGATALAENLKELRLGNNNHDTDTTAALMMSTLAPVITTSASADSSSSSEGAATTTTSHTIEEEGELSSLYVGRIIGKGGETIRDLQARSGCHIDVNQNVERGAPRIITYRGRRHEDIHFAKQLVAILCTEDNASLSKHAELPLGRATMKQIQVPESIIGRIIGRGGEMIRELQSKSHARIQVDHSGEAAAGMDSSADHGRQVTITGTKDSVAKAEEMIMFLSTHPGLDHGHHPAAVLVRDKDWSDVAWRAANSNNLPIRQQGQQGLPRPADNVATTGGGGPYWDGGYEGQDHTAVAGYGNYGSQQGIWNDGTNQYAAAAPTSVIMETDILPCAKADIGHLIGRKGATINDLQRRSNCSIQIDQRDCEINITGPRQGIEMAKQMVRAIIERGSNHPYAGGRRFEQHEPSSQQQQQQLGYADQQHYHQSQVYPNEQYGIMPQQQYYAGQPMTMYHQQQPQQQQPYSIQQQQAQQEYPAQAASSSPWRAATATDGQIYYYNENTLESRWDKPEEMP
mmetsp:Transcript_359/g.741  ORF Transcript_359/g.741 Transcript_359/m.741 type:complete len:600 (-) Transcript_359:198-1997(-)